MKIVIIGGSGIAALVMLAAGTALFAPADEPGPQARGKEGATASQEDGSTLPNPGFTIDPRTTALVVTDPQNDFLSPAGVAWDVVGKSVTTNGTVENLTDLFRAAKDAEIPVFISPHYYFPLDLNGTSRGRLKG